MTRRLLLAPCALVLLALALWGCHEDEPRAVEATPDARLMADRGPMPDTAPMGDATPPDADLDAADLDAAGPDFGPPAEGPVEVDLTEALAPRPDAEGEAPARAFVAAGPADLVSGPTAQGRVGDYVLENGRVRFVIEADDRVIGPCPFGGNVIDADVRRLDGEPGADMVGELCLMLMLGQTLDPQRYDIVRDGSDGGAAVLAVTGRPTLLDFINLKGILSAFGGAVGAGGLRLNYDTDGELPLTLTIYYVLRPGDTGLRVISALRNDGDATVHMPVGHLIDSGGDVEVFSPQSPTGGFGNVGLGADALNGVPLTAVAFNGPGGGHAYVPRANPEFEADYPSSGRYIWVSGVVASLVGVESLLSTLLASPARIPQVPGIAHIAPRQVHLVEHWHFVGDGSPSSLMDAAWPALGAETASIAGRVRVGDRGLAGVRVSAVDEAGRAINQAVSDGDGRYAMRVPAGRYTLAPWKPGHIPQGAAVAVQAEGEAQADDVVLGDAGRVAVAIRRPDGSATPGRVTVACIGECPQWPDATVRDVSNDGPIGGLPAIVFTGVDGLADIPLPPGRYRVLVSRGPEWSVWPPDGIETGGREVEIVGGDVVALDAEIAKVVDTTGWLSGDFHVHGINSPDAPVALDLRVRTFLAEGVDVLVSTDHDYVTDYRPIIAALGAEDELIGVTGVELTTFDYGHYNSFPLVADPQSRNGGAVDWAGGRGMGLTPDAIYRALEDHSPGERVIQINHPNSGAIGALDVDLLRGYSRADPSVYRLPATEPDPVTGDTGLWSERFTAMEIMNGHGTGSFNGRMRWWLTFVGRGFTPTATAVSDTHKTIESQSGGPRSYVWVGPEADRPATFDEPRFVRAVNAGRLFGSNGPVVDLRLTAGEATARLGDTIASAPGEAVTVEVDVQTPAWMRVEALDLFVNVVDPLLPDPDEFDETAIPPSHTVALEQVGVDEVAVGAESHRRRRFTGRFELRPEVDSYVVGVVRGGDSMWPVVLNRGVRPVAYTNPIYVDVDGGGYDRFPLAEAAAGAPKKARRRPAPASRPMTVRDVHRFVEWLAEGHEH